MSTEYAHMQLDSPKYNPKFYSVPSNVPSRIAHEDYIYFVFPETVNRNDYTVVIESLDTAGPRFKKIGYLEGRIQLPAVWLPADGKLSLVPGSSGLPSFHATCTRGATYIVKDPRPMRQTRDGKSVLVPVEGAYKMQQIGLYM